MDTGSENREETQSNPSSEMSENKEDEEAPTEITKEASQNPPSTQPQTIQPQQSIRGSIDAMGANAGGTDPNSVDAMSQLLTDKPLVFTLKSKAMEAHD